MRVLAFIVLISLLLVSCKGKATDTGDKKSSEKVVTKEVKDTTTYSEDAEMNAAILEARKTLPDFYTRLASPQPGDNGFSLKVKISDANGEEECWFSEVKVQGDSLVGILSNKPTVCTSFSEGTFRAINEEDIRDWMYFQNRKMIGNKTVYPLIKSLSPREAFLMKRSLGIE